MKLILSWAFFNPLNLAGQRAVTDRWTPRCALLALLLAGCTSPAATGADPEAGAAQAAPCTTTTRSGDEPVLVATATSAEPAPSLTSTAAVELLRAARADGDFCVLVLTPHGTKLQLALTPHRSNGAIERGSRRERMVDRNLAGVRQALGRLAATAPELDPLGALTEAARTYPQARNLYLVTSGVSTVAPVDLRRLGWDTDPRTLARALADGHWLPDLRGRTVHLLGLGDTAGTQPAPTTPLRERLTALWSTVCQATGAHCTVDPERLDGGPPLSRNRVALVPLPAPSRAPDLAVLPASALFPLGSAAVTPEADRILAGAVQQALDHRLQVSVVGHTDASTGTPAANLALSRDRARSIATRLTALGLPAERVTSVEGVGSAGNSAAAERADPGLISRHRTVELHFTAASATAPHATTANR